MEVRLILAVSVIVALLLVACVVSLFARPATPGPTSPAAPVDDLMAVADAVQGAAPTVVLRDVIDCCLWELDLDGAR